MKSSGLICLPLIVLAGCTQQKLTETACIVAHESGFAGTTGNREHITVPQNGKPCVIDMTAGRQGPGFGGEIAKQPQHGTAAIRATAYATLISYVPDRDYVGPDSFELSFGPDFNATIVVTVAALPSG
jgi:hypothetical protein